MQATRENLIAGMRHTYPSSTDPSSTDPSPTDPSPTDPSPTDPSPTDPSPTDPSTTDPSPTDPSPTDPSLPDPSPTDPRLQGSGLRGTSLPSPDMGLAYTATNRDRWIGTPSSWRASRGGLEPANVARQVQQYAHIWEAWSRPEKILNEFKSYASRALNQWTSEVPDRKR